MRPGKKGKEQDRETTDKLVTRMTEISFPNTVNDKLKVVIPAGGHGYRMAPVTSGMPKTLIPLHDRPLLIAILEELDPEVFEEAIVLCNHWHRMVQRYVDAFRDNTIQIKVTCDPLLGRMYPPKALLRLLEDGRLTNPFLLHYCDVYAPGLKWIEFKNDFQKKREQSPTVLGELVVSSRHQQSVGMIKYDEETKLITNFHQKPSTFERENAANTAIGLFTTEFVRQYVKEDDHDVFDSSIGEALEHEVRSLAVYVIQKWYHFDHPQSWADLQRKQFPENLGAK